MPLKFFFIINYIYYIFTETRPFCLLPKFIVGFLKNPVSIIPADEFPNIKSQCFRALAKSDPKVVVTLIFLFFLYLETTSLIELLPRSKFGNVTKKLKFNFFNELNNIFVFLKLFSYLIVSELIDTKIVFLLISREYFL